MRSFYIAWTLSVCTLTFAQNAPKPDAAKPDATKKEADLTDAKEILKRAAAAAKAVRVIKYNAVAKGYGADEPKRPTVEGSAMFGGWLGNGPAKYRFEVKSTKPGATESTEYIAGTDGEIVYLVDKAAKMVYADIDPAVLGSNGRVTRSILVGKIVDPDAFKDELAAEKVELKGVVSVEGHDCYQINVDFGSERGEAVWYLSKTDFIPRKTERIFPQDGGQKGGRVVTLSNVVVNPRPPTDDVDPFAVVVPEGFKKTDDFAP